MNKMYRRKLEALGYPLFDDFEFNDAFDQRLRNLIVWLEDQKIRHYPMEEREGLRNIDSVDWPLHFQKYLKHVGITFVNPFESQNLEELVEWLLGLAIRLEYDDDVETFSEASSKYLTGEVPKSSTSNNPFEELDFNSQEFAAGISAIAKKLEVTEHPDKCVTLEAIARLIKSCYTNKVLETPTDFQPKGKEYPLLEYDMGFGKGDYVMNQAAKVLRILYVEDLRDLQTKINECIVACQTITADPQVETKLMKTGQFLAGLQKNNR